MKSLQLIKSICFIVLATCCMFTSFAQPSKGKRISLDKDTVRINTASQRVKDFKDSFEGKGNKSKRATETVSFSVSRLKELLDSLHSQNVEVLEFKFATIRPEDVATYVANHPEQSLSPAEQKELVGRPTLLIKVPRKTFNTSLARGVATSSGALQDESMYLDLGSICPPPSSCR